MLLCAIFKRQFVRLFDSILLLGMDSVFDICDLDIVRLKKIYVPKYRLYRIVSDGASIHEYVFK